MFRVCAIRVSMYLCVRDLGSIFIWLMRCTLGTICPTTSVAPHHSAGCEGDIHSQMNCLEWPPWPVGKCLRSSLWDRQMSLHGAWGSIVHCNFHHQATHLQLQTMTAHMDVWLKQIYHNNVHQCPFGVASILRAIFIVELHKHSEQLIPKLIPSIFNIQLYLCTDKLIMH